MAQWVRVLATTNDLSSIPVTYTEDSHKLSSDLHTLL